MSGVQVHSERAHSKWGASSADRWMNCPASVKLIEKAPPQKSSHYAQEGTCAHELAEIAMVEDKPCSHYVGQTMEGWEVTEEMAEYVQTYVDYVLQASSGINKDLLLEEKFHLNFIREGLFGSNDACVLEFMGTLEVIDLKYGKGKVVEAVDNKQLMYYALGAGHGSDFTQIKLTIVQPRVKDPIKSHTITMDELNKYAEELGKAVDATKMDDANFSAGSHCFFCPAKGICKEQRKSAQKVACMDFGVSEPKTESSLPSAEVMDAKTLRNILEHADGVKKWLDSVQAYAMHKLEKGLPVDGYKLVKSKVNRKVQSETELKMAFGDEIYEQKLLGIGKLEKKFGKEQVAEFLFKPEAKLTMAKESDKREAVYANSIAQDFGIDTKTSEEANINNFETITF